MMVVATDAPLDHRNLNRLAARAMMGLARTGSSGTNGSGDYAIAFSAAREFASKPAAPCISERNCCRMRACLHYSRP